MSDLNKKFNFEGKDTVPDNPQGGTITAIGIVAAFVTMVGMGALYTKCYGLFDFDDSLPQGSQKIEFTAPEEGHERSPFTPD